MADTLGWIPPADRTPEMQDAHAKAVANMPRFAVTGGRTLAKGERVDLSAFWNKSDVIEETKLTWKRTPFWQLTGSCVGAGGGNALFTLICVQRMLSEGATKAFVPWWPFSYGRSRTLAGMRGRGEGSFGSAFIDTIVKEGVLSADEQGLPDFRQSDGALLLTEKMELDWSDGQSRLVADYIDEARPHPLGTGAEIRSTEQGRDAIVNGYPWTFACLNNIAAGSPRVRGSGKNARLVGSWNAYGPHQQFVFAFEENEELGPLFGVGNNWPTSVYAQDPGGLPLVSCWVTEADVAKAMRLDGEVYALSHLNWFPAQPRVLDWLI